jgi:hypothetical protein
MRFQPILYGGNMTGAKRKRGKCERKGKKGEIVRKGQNGTKIRKNKCKKACWA